MEQWTTTLDTRLAAALATLGVPVQVKSILDTATNIETTRFFLGLEALDRSFRTKRLKRDFFKGELETKTPSHPLLNIYRGFINRDALGAIMEKGACYRLVAVPGTESWQYVPSDSGLPGLPKRNTELIKTADQDLAAALGVVGLPVIHIEGRDFYLPRRGPVREGLGRVDGLRLMTDWRADHHRIPWEDPFAQSVRGLACRQDILDNLQRQAPVVLLRKPRSLKAAYLLPGSTDAAYDQVADFFGG